jgi:gluconate 2-dehydrogenase gamma chain
VESTAAPPAPAPAADAANALPRAAAASRLFLTEQEAAFIAAAVDRLIPADETWPGAAEAGVVDYIDRQLAGAYGSGSRMYLEGPWPEGTPQQGYQLPLTPAQLYREAIRGIGVHLGQAYGGRAFEQLTANEQDGLLRALETGTLDIGDAPAAVFFETLLANTIEGFFADPIYGGNRDMVGWRMVGFPGAYAQFVYEVDRHGVRFDRPPMSMAQSAHGAHGEASWPPG